MGNPGIGGAGGIIRDSRGRLILAFSVGFGTKTSMQAKAKAMLVGVRLCAQQGLTQVLVESDSLVLVRVLNDECKRPWSIDKELEHIRRASFSTLKVQHCFREANRIADILAKEGCNKSMDEISIFGRTEDLPRLVRGEYRLDRMSYPSFRVRRRPSRLG
ncbi:uncharacterized protein [Coffea arabica]|uniref:RNase H type-1 domain-containing protein n=1 Tax=Coffea arabica TaxID=13443 RepID=A0ABM4VQG5_COFAR